MIRFSLPAAVLPRVCIFALDGTPTQDNSLAQEGSAVQSGTDVLSKAAGTNSGQLPDNENGSAAPDTATENTANVPENGDTSTENRNIKASDTLAGAPAAADIYPPAIPAAAGQTPPSAPTKDTGGKPPHSNDSPETPYETRYFTLSLDENGTVLSADVKSIAAIDKETAVSLAGELFASDKTKGFALGYRYGARTESGYAYTGGTVLTVGLAGGMSGETTTSSPLVLHDRHRQHASHYRGNLSHRGRRLYRPRPRHDERARRRFGKDRRRHFGGFLFRSRIRFRRRIPVLIYRIENKKQPA